MIVVFVMFFCGWLILGQGRSSIPYFERIIGICAGECHSPLHISGVRCYLLGCLSLGVGRGNDCCVCHVFCGWLILGQGRWPIPYFERIIGICAGECHSPLHISGVRCYLLGGLSLGVGRGNDCCVCHVFLWLVDFGSGAMAYSIF
ncbi:hypothetical protein [Okeania sp. KiyG1]|uniref:hypothetical protein n=1 Tax=Okeania sp. KiyG1 TaxID=2720165 RepID=UPI001921E155|nr:hypothetical protein [Okeania sp. KiyG1]